MKQLALAVILVSVLPALSWAADMTRTSKTHMAALTQTETRMTPRPDVVRTACFDNHLRCDSAAACPSQCCAPHTFQCDNNGYCECSW
jgi:hypothetical protein